MGGGHIQGFSFLFFLHGDGDSQLFGSLSLNGERRWRPSMALPLLSSFYTWFVCVVCVLVDKVSTDVL